MAKRCLSCKRDIADGQKSCFVCGSSQNLVAHYFGSGLFILFVMLIAAAASYWFISKANQEIETNLGKLETAQLQIQQAESKATRAINQLKQLRQAAAQAKNDAEKNDELNADAQVKIAAAEKKVSNAQKNVNWLAKQNGELKNQVQTLTEQLSTAQLDIAQQSSTQLSEDQLTESQVNQRIEQARQADAQIIQELRQQLQNVQQQLAALQTTDN